MITKLNCDLILEANLQWISVQYLTIPLTLETETVWRFKVFNLEFTIENVLLKIMVTYVLYLLMEFYFIAAH